MSFIPALQVHYIHALTLEELREQVHLAMRAFQPMEGEPSDRIELEGRPFRAKIQDFPEYVSRLTPYAASRAGATGFWVQAVVQHPGQE